MNYLSLLLGLFALSACVDRTLTVVSEPPGARVYLDTVPRGFTPLTLPFPHYGTRKVVLVKPNYHRAAQIVELVAPWYERWGLSFFSSVVWPGNLKDEHRVTLQLEPLKDEDKALEDRARAARDALDHESR